MDEIPGALGLDADAVRKLLTTAGQAPSLHNSQPWSFRVRPDVIQLWADPLRALPAADPTGREQRLACGAALYNLRLALHDLWIRPLVTLHPRTADSDLLASVRYGGRKPPTPLQQQLLAAVPRRHTNRSPFSDEPVAAAARSALRRAALEEGAWLHLVDDPTERTSLQQLAAQANAAQRNDPAFRAELTAWTATDDHRRDGIPHRPHERRPTAHEPWVVRDFTGGTGRTTADAGTHFEHAPLIAILTANVYGPTEELVAGQALQRVLLTATADGLAVSFLSHVIEVEETCSALRRLLRNTNSPLAALRIGHGWPVPTTPRRPVAELLRPEPVGDGRPHV